MFLTCFWTLGQLIATFTSCLSSQIVFFLPFHKMSFGLPIAMLVCKQISSSILAFYIFDILEMYVKFLVSNNYFTTLRCYDKKTIVVWCSFTTKHSSWFLNCFENHLFLNITTKIWGCGWSSFMQTHNVILPITSVPK
jgi:hypothetical protein